MTKVVIIGSGLGGLSCGAILSQNGMDVTVLEQGAVAGGCLQCFWRGGVKFESGMHYVGSAKPGQPLDRILRYLGVRDRVDFSPLDPSGYDVIYLGDRSYRFANGRDAFVATLAKDFPDNAGEIEAYYDLVEKVSEASAMQTLDFASSDLALTMEYQSKAVGPVISSVISNPLLAGVLAGENPLYAGIENKTSFANHAFITTFYNRSAHRFVGGSDTLVKALVDKIQSAGGRVLTGHKVTSIVCNATKADGVLTAGGEFFPADLIISDAHPARTVELLDTKLIRPAYKERIRTMPQTVGAFSVYIKFKEGVLPYMNHNEFLFNRESPWGCENYTPASWPEGLIYMHTCHEKDPGFARCGVIISYMRIEDLSRWENTTVGRRGPTYEEFKKASAQKILAFMEKYHPGFQSAIENYWTSTPLTYRDYTGTQGGSMYGIERSISSGPGGRITHRTRVPNLLLTGQNINSHGIMGVLVGAFLTCGEVLGPDTILNQIKEAGI